MRKFALTIMINFIIATIISLVLSFALGLSIGGDGGFGGDDDAWDDRVEFFVFIYILGILYLSFAFNSFNSATMTTEESHIYFYTNIF